MKELLTDFSISTPHLTGSTFLKMQQCQFDNTEFKTSSQQTPRAHLESVGWESDVALTLFGLHGSWAQACINSRVQDYFHCETC